MNNILPDVYGFLDPAETELLLHLATNASGDIVELGSYQGRSTVALALGAQLSGVTVWAVDPHDTYQALDTEYGMHDNAVYYDNVTRYGVGHIVKTINLRSDEFVRIWDKPISLLWIDADHSYESVKRDFEQWSPFVVSNGNVVMHDTSGNFPDVSQFVNELLAAGEWTRVELIDATSVFIRVLNK